MCRIAALLVSLSLCFQRGSRRGAGLLKWELQRRVPRSDPHAGFRLAGGLGGRSPARVGAVFGERGGRLLSTR